MLLFDSRPASQKPTGVARKTLRSTDSAAGLAIVEYAILFGLILLQLVLIWE